MITINSLKLHSLYNVFIIISILLYVIYIYLNLRKDKIMCLLFIIFMVPIIIVFGKLYTVISTQNFDFFSVGLSSYGGAIGLILFSFIYSKITKNDNYFKYTIIFLPCMYGIAKLGCFFNGCCFGIPYDGPMAINYLGRYWDSVFPIQLLESIVFITIFILFHKNNNVSYVVFVSAISKFLLDYLRFSHINKFITANQITSLIIISITIILTFINKKEKLK